MLDLTAAEILELQSRGTSAEEITSEFLQAIRTDDAALGAYLHVDEELALAQARAVDVKRKLGQPLGALAGVPVAIKDVICVAGQPTTCASEMLRGFIPPYDAHVITRLKQADAILLGKTNMDEFGMGSSTETSGFKVTHNPWDPERTPGGSSGGSAAAVAASLAPLALGSDTGGSIRQPAAFCGVVGLKPTYGRVSRFGLIAYASSLDQIGPIAKNVSDAALLLETIAGCDPRDSTCVDRPVPAFTRILDEPVKRCTIGVPKEFFSNGLVGEVEQTVRAAIKLYKDRGAVIKEISLPHTSYAVAAYYLIVTAEASSNLARYDGVRFGHRAAKYEDLQEMVARSRGDGFGSEVKRRILLGTFVLSAGYADAYYVKALKVRRLIKDDFDRAFAQCEVLIGPTTPTAPFKLGEKTNDPLTMYLSDIYTISANLAGIPAISIPGGFTKTGLPVGLQLLAPAFEEECLLRVARMFEQATSGTGNGLIARNRRAR